MLFFVKIYIITKCDVDIREDLILYNIVLSGGSTMFDGIAERITKHLKEWVKQEEYDEAVPVIVQGKCLLIVCD